MILLNDERFKRTRLVYSIEQDRIFCFCRILFSTLIVKFVTDYNDWKNVGYAINTHETKICHIKPFSTWSELLILLYILLL